jgi:hypothetical protein
MMHLVNDVDSNNTHAESRKCLVWLIGGLA